MQPCLVGGHINDQRLVFSQQGIFLLTFSGDKLGAEEKRDGMGAEEQGDTMAAIDVEDQGSSSGSGGNGGNVTIGVGALAAEPCPPPQPLPTPPPLPPPPPTPPAISRFERLSPSSGRAAGQRRRRHCACVHHCSPPTKLGPVTGPGRRKACGG